MILYHLILTRIGISDKTTLSSIHVTFVRDILLLSFLDEFGYPKWCLTMIFATFDLLNDVWKNLAFHSQPMIHRRLYRNQRIYGSSDGICQGSFYQTDNPDRTCRCRKFLSFPHDLQCLGDFYGWGNRLQKYNLPTLQYFWDGGVALVFSWRYELPSLSVD